MYDNRNLIKKGYTELYESMTSGDSIKDQMYKEMFTVPVTRTLLTTFTAIKGKSYNKKHPRFMLVGRATNGWDEKRDYSKVIESKEFVESVYDNFVSAPGTTTDGNDNNRFEWIDDAPLGFHPKNRYRRGIDALESVVEALPYSLHRPFWGYSKDIWWQLIKREADTENRGWFERWYDNIVWSNLYKVAPTSGWNPDEELKKRQLEACKEILREEISIFKPDYVLFVTGYKDWFDAFDKDVFDKPLMKTSEKKYVEAMGKVSLCGEDKSEIKVIVVCRPEQKKKAEYVGEVVAAFNTL